MQPVRIFVAAALMLTLSAPVTPQTTPAPPPYRAPQHTTAPPAFDRMTPDEITLYANAGLQMERARPPAWSLAEHRRLGRALAAVAPQRKGVVDAYVVVAALDSDPVFGREAREAAKVLARRYDATGRTILLAGTDGTTQSTHPRGSLDALSVALARVAEVMDPKEDVLILYTTSHGSPSGIVYNDGDEGFGILSPYRLWWVLRDLGIENRMLIVSACYSGIFVPLLSSDTTAVMSAAADDRSSFGCLSENDWTFYGDALINRAFRKPRPLAAAVAEAQATVAGWEVDNGLSPASNPQVMIGAKVATWLAPLEARTPRAATAPVGRPSTESLAKLRGQ